MLTIHTLTTRFRDLPCQPVHLSRFLGKLCLFFLLPSFLLTACHFNEKFSSPLWFYRPSPNSHSRWDTVLNRASFLDLEPDGRFTRYFDRFEYGKWTLLNDRLFLTCADSLTYVYKVDSNNKKDLRIEISSIKIAHFEAKPRPPSDTSDNPFSRYNNWWRIPAAAPESVAAIRQRLLDHLHFWETYIKWDDDNNIGALDLKDIPSPLKIHGNGFGLFKYDFLPAKWKASFFGEADCRTADSLIRSAFKRTDIKWPYHDDDEKADKNLISGIQQIEAALK
jgi:hypothetical protein